MIKIKYLPEPSLQFGGYFEHQDAKTGLSEFGPFGKNISGLHPSEIRLGFIGTRETVSWAQEWIARCSSYIESENIKKVSIGSTEDEQRLFDLDAFYDTPQTLSRLEKILTPDFIGFNSDSPFNCDFQTNERWVRYILPNELAPILSLQNKTDVIWQLVNLFDENIASIADTDPTPDIIILALPPEIEEQAYSVRVSGNFFLNFRRAIKARSMRWNIPLQLINESTATGEGRNVQDVATRAWNFCTAQYYKANGVPWRITTLDEATCFVGISFFITQDFSDVLTMRSSVAQAFDYLGQGLILRGDYFNWDVQHQGRTPHLTKDGAKKLIRDTLNEYVRLKGHPPRRVVIHKTSEFWGKDHSEFNELDGFQEEIGNIFNRCETDFVSLAQSGTRLFREGKYPPLRGTYFSINNSQHYLYTMGYIPFLETYPQSYVPEPWQIMQHVGGSSPESIFKEVLALTKMNVNNCAFADGWPITLSFSKMVGEIMKHIPENGVVQPKYRFYM
jgi:hypothetical protein